MFFQSTASLNPQPSASQKLTELTKEYWDVSNRLSPLSATENNIPGYNDQLDDISAVGRAERRKQMQRFLQELLKIDRNALIPTEQDTWEILKYFLEISLAEDDLKLYRWDVDYLYGPQVTLPVALLRSQPTSTEKDAIDYIARLKLIEKYLQDHITNLKERLEAGQTSTYAAVQRTINILADLLKNEVENSPFANVGKKFSPILQEKYFPQIFAVIKQYVYPAFQNYRDFLQKEYLQHCRSDEKPGLVYMPGGKELYAFAIKYHTTIEKTGEEIHLLGLQDLQKIHSQMLEIAKRSGYSGDLLSFMKKITDDPNNFFTTSKDVEKAANDVVSELKEKLPNYFASIPKTPLEVKPMQEFRAKNGIGANILGQL